MATRDTHKNRSLVHDHHLNLLSLYEQKSSPRTTKFLEGKLKNRVAYREVMDEEPSFTVWNIVIPFEGFLRLQTPKINSIRVHKDLKHTYYMDIIRL